MKQVLAVLGTPEEMRGWFFHLANAAYKKDVILDLAERTSMVHLEDVIQSLRQKPEEFIQETRGDGVKMTRLAK